jgi:hypothetical protein
VNLDSERIIPKIYSFDVFGTLIGPIDVVPRSLWKNLTFTISRRLGSVLFYHPIHEITQLETYSHPELRQFYNELIINGEIVFLVSDTHLSEEAVKCLIEANGLLTPTKIFTSSQQLKSKKHGLFACVAEESNFAIWQHFGDDYEKDQKSEEYGATFIQIVNGEASYNRSHVLNKTQKSVMKSDSEFFSHFRKLLDINFRGVESIWELVGGFYAYLSAFLFATRIMSYNKSSGTHWLLVGRDMALVSEILKELEFNDFSLVYLKRLDIGDANSKSWNNVLHIAKQSQALGNSLCIADISYRRTLSRELIKHGFAPAIELYLFRRPGKKKILGVDYVLRRHGFLDRLVWGSFKEIWEILLCINLQDQSLASSDQDEMIKGFSRVLGNSKEFFTLFTENDRFHAEKVFASLILHPNSDQSRLLGSLLHDANSSAYHSINLIQELEVGKPVPYRSLWRISTLLAISRIAKSDLFRFTVLFARWLRCESLYLIDTLKVRIGDR